VDGCPADPILETIGVALFNLVYSALELNVAFKTVAGRTACEDLGFMRLGLCSSLSF
jgi:hypothetical protein